MRIKLKKIISNRSILKFFIISPLLFLPFIASENKKAIAGFEFQWNAQESYKRLTWFQKNNTIRSRNKIYLFLRPSERKTGLLKITLDIPKRFRKILKEEKISLCQVRIGGFESRTKCLEEISADFEFTNDKSQLNIFPYSPVPSNKKSYAIVFKVNNPRRSGLYQFHSYGQAPGKIPVSSYLGSWTIVID